MNASEEGSGSCDWNTEDELEIFGYQDSEERPSPSFPSALPLPFARDHVPCNSDEASSSSCKIVRFFKNMGFPEELIAKAVRENGEENEDSILKSILRHLDLENIPAHPLPANSDQSSSEYDDGFLDDFSDSSNFSEEEENIAPTSERILLFLQNMGYTEEEGSKAMNICGSEASIDELINFILADQISNTDDVHRQEVSEPKRKLIESYYADSRTKKRKLHDSQLYGRANGLYGDIRLFGLPRPMVGFGLPVEVMPQDAPSPRIQRSLPEQATGPPFFYFENVARAPQGVWEKISQLLYGTEPEFVDSIYLCAAARKRGYMHNLPLKGRLTLKPLPPHSIHDAFPSTKKWWPKWDKRTKLNCIQTAIGSAKLTERITKWIDEHNGEPPHYIQKRILEECRRWNLVWVAEHTAAPLEPDELECLMGFPINHTRGLSRTNRYKSLGNAFQVDTVAYHLSVLEPIFPNGINVLSLFWGIGGAEIALHRLGIPLKNVISVEISKVNRYVLRRWWKQTHQRGKLTHYDDVRHLDEATLKQIMKSIGRFDLVIGGSPCNNLSGSNRYSRDGLEGKESSLFFEFVRILDSVKRLTANQ